MNGVESMLKTLEPVGRHAPTGGYRRLAWTPADQACREWFLAEAVIRGLDTEVDRNGNLWAWWGDQGGADVVAMGSHLDSVVDGGPYDGPLGVVSGFAAIDILRASAAPPKRPVALVAFADEEGARFGAPCVGSRLLTGAADPSRTRALRDADGVSMEEAMRAVGQEPRWMGPDHVRLTRLRTFVELHIEQGLGLERQSAPVGIGTAIWPHGRFRFDFQGRANHAGTTALADRDDPTLPAARAVLAARRAAADHNGLATVGRLIVQPNNTNAVPAFVRAWLDVRAATVDSVKEIVARVSAAAGTSPEMESWTDPVSFEASLVSRTDALLGCPPHLATGAGHDAGVLAAAGVPALMLFVRNRTGVSHAPDEYATPDDCVHGVGALVSVLKALAWE